MSTPAFDAAALARGYGFLDVCPPHVLDEIITLPGGRLQDRVAAVLAWREALLRGQIPAAPAPTFEAIDAPVRKAFEELDIARFCRQAPELVDVLLTDIVAAWRRGHTAFAGEVDARLRELEKIERERRAAAAQAGDEGERPQPLSETERDALRAAAAQEVAERERGADPEFVGAWTHEAHAWSKIADVFGDLGHLLGRGWDLSQGVLRHAGWRELEALRRLIEKLPALREIVEALGRFQDAQEGESVAHRIMQPVRRVDEEQREVHAPDVPHEIRGVERSGEVARMLPSQAVMLGHPKLRLLWHARRAERALLTYRAEGTRIETILTETDSSQEVEEEAPRPIRGPIIAVVDTSGSMLGAPERVAKALVLEALRAAHAEERRCYLYAFSGPGDLAEHELDLTAEGIARLLAFLSTSFGGGTDPSTALTPVVQRLRLPEWSRADVLIVSDGEFGVPSGLLRSAEAARENGARLHGVLVGSSGMNGLAQLCEPMHVFRDWLTLGNVR